MASIGQTAFQLSFQISPIILTNGIATPMGGMLPIVTLTQSASFIQSILSGNASSILDLDSYFAQWHPMPGTQLVSNQIGNYPFANQAIAANAIIAQPLNISMLMRCPVHASGGYAGKLVTITALKAALDLHTAAGGTYIVATPSQIYTSCVLLSVRDASSSGSAQAQTDWQFDFVQPLLTESAAQSVYNTLMNKIGGGLPTGSAPSVSGVSAAIGGAVTSASGAISGVSSQVSGLQGSLTTSISSTVSGASSPIIGL